MAAAERLARARGCLRIEVTSRCSRADARTFCRRLGFADACEPSARFIKVLDGSGPPAGEEAGRATAGATGWGLSVIR